MVSQSVTGRVFGLPLEVQDPLMTEAAMAAYEIPATRHEMVKHDAGLRVGYWRSVSHALNAFANESFIDECAAAAGQDPYAYRMLHAARVGAPGEDLVAHFGADVATEGLADAFALAQAVDHGDAARRVRACRELAGREPGAVP